MQEVDIDYLQTNAQRELEESKSALIIRMHRVYARKKPPDSILIVVGKLNLQVFRCKSTVTE